MMILGIDPGTIKAGFGVVEIRDGRPCFVDCGTINLGKTQDMPDRLLFLHESIDALIVRYQPLAVAVETQYMMENPKSALQLSMARGIVLVAARKGGVPVFEYSPSKIKQAVTGSGQATKALVQKTIQTIGRLETLPAPDAADAVSIAICHGAHLAKESQQSLWQNQA